MAHLNTVSRKTEIHAQDNHHNFTFLFLVIFAMRFFPRLGFHIQRLLQNPFVKAILFRSLWRIVRLLIFRS